MSFKRAASTSLISATNRWHGIPRKQPSAVPVTISLLSTNPVPTKSDPLMTALAAKPYVNAFHNTLTTAVAAAGTHECAFFLAAANKNIATIEAANYYDKDDILFFARLRELGIILFRELFGVKNSIGDLVSGENVFWLSATALGPTRLDALPNDLKNGQPAGRIAKVTAAELNSVLQSLHSVTKTANSAVHALYIGDVIRLMQNPVTKSQVGDGPFAFLAKMMETILGKSHTTYNLYTMDPILRNKLFISQVQSFKKQIKEVKMFKRIDTEWAAAYRNDKWVEITQKLEEDGRLLTPEHKNNLESIPKVKNTVFVLEQELAQLRQQMEVIMRLHPTA